MTSTDRIERRVVVRAPRSRVWRAISSAEEFSQWFVLKVEGVFAEGARIPGRLTRRGHEDVTVDMLIEWIEPERYFSYRWHPYALDAAVDYAAEPTTLVEFTLEDTDDGTAVAIVESGFDRIPPDRRDLAFRMNDQGWAGEIKNLVRYVS